MVTYPTTIDYNKMFLKQFTILKEQMVAESELSLYSEASSIFSYGYNPEILTEAKGDRTAFFRGLLQRVRQIWQMFLTNVEQLFVGNMKWVKENQDAIVSADFDKAIGNDGYEMYPYFKAATILNRNQVPAFNKTDKNLLESLTSADSFRERYFKDFIIANVPFNEGVRLKFRGVSNYRNPENDKKQAASTIRSNIQNMVDAVINYKTTQIGLNSIHKEVESTANEAIAEIRKQATTAQNNSFFVRLEGRPLNEMNHVDYQTLYEYLQYTFQTDLFNVLEHGYFEDCNLMDAKKKLFRICENVTNGEFPKAKEYLHTFRKSLNYFFSEEFSEHRATFDESMLEMFSRLDILESFYEDKEYKYVRSLREGTEDNPEAGAGASTDAQDVTSSGKEQSKENAETNKVNTDVQNDESSALIKKYELYIKEAQSFCSIKMSIFEEKNKAYMRLFKTLVGDTSGDSDKADGKNIDKSKSETKDPETELAEVKEKITELQRISEKTVTQEGELTIAKRRRKELEKKLK